MSKVLQPIMGRYADYTLSPANRVIYPGNLEAIYEEVQNAYLLDCYPIVIDPANVILDGQHRHTVARELRLPFYAIQEQNIAIGDISRANANTLAYSLTDASQVYDKTGMKAYQIFNTFMLRNRHLKASFCAKILDPDTERAAFLAGSFVVRTPVYAQVVADMISDYAGQPGKSFVWSSCYPSVIANLALNPLYNHQRMMSSLKTYPSQLTKVVEHAEAFTVLTGLYNYRRLRDDSHRVTLRKVTKNSENVVYDTMSEIVDDGGAKSSRPLTQSEVVVKVSSDYSAFKLHPHRRPLDQRRLTKLIEFMGEKNLLSCYPIVCDPAGTILDGQRRFAAARQLGLPVHYIVVSGVTLPMIVRASTSSKSWVLHDYLHHYSVLEYPEYLVLANFRREYPVFELAICVSMLSGELTEGQGRARHLFASGQFKITELALMCQVGDYLMLIDDRKLRANTTFQRAFTRVVKSTPGFDMRRFVAKLKENPEKIKNFADVEGCLEAIRDTYNHGLRSPVAKLQLDKDKIAA